jgi:hypothetical protein
MQRISALIGVGLVAALALSGCVPTTDETASSTREASTLGTRVCVVNNTDMNMRIKWRGYPNARPVAPGFENCNSGYEDAGTPDVAAALEYEPNLLPGSPLTLYLEGNNPGVMEAQASAYFKRGSQKWGVRHLFDVGDERSFQEKWVRVTIKKLPESDRHKEWAITITPPSGDDYISDITYYGRGPGF